MVWSPMETDFVNFIRYFDIGAAPRRRMETSRNFIGGRRAPPNEISLGIFGGLGASARTSFGSSSLGLSRFFWRERKLIQFVMASPPLKQKSPEETGRLGGLMIRTSDGFLGARSTIDSGPRPCGEYSPVGDDVAPPSSTNRGGC